MVIEFRERKVIEQNLSCKPEVYSVEDDKFLYYLEEGRLHISKASTDWSMSVEEWENFISRIIKVSDEYFVTGEGKDIGVRMGFLGKYLAKYSRRREFLSGLLDIIEDSRGWECV